MNIRDSVVAGQTSKPERSLSLHPQEEQATVQHSSSMQRENSVLITRGGMRSLVMRPRTSVQTPIEDSPVRDRIPAWDPDAHSALELQRKKYPAAAPDQGIIAGPDEVGADIQVQGQRKSRVKNPCVPGFWKPSNMCSCTKTRTKSFMDVPAEQQNAVAPAEPKDAKTSLRVKNFCYEQSRNVLLLCR